MTLRKQFEAPRAEGELGPEDFAMFHAGVGRFHPVDAEAAQACLAHCRIRTFARGEFLLRAGERATQAGMLVSGLLREYFLMESGVERTKAFVMAGEPTGSLADLLHEGGSRAYIVAEEPSRLIVVPFEAMLALSERYLSWRIYGERLLQLLFLKKAEREYELLGLDALARYRAFLRKFPDLSARVPDRHIASYLGITPVHLSRLRRKARA
jgi:CRP-like cAMP-binding protein